MGAVGIGTLHESPGSGAVTAAVRTGRRLAAGLSLVAAALFAPFAGAQTVSITSTPANGTHYVSGEAVTTRLSGLSTNILTLGGSGNNSMTLDIGGVSRSAGCGRPSGTTTVNCSYTVTVNDVDANGISIPANSIGGPVWRSGALTIGRNHAALTDQAAHEVIGSAAAISSTTPSALSWSNLDGATLALDLTGVTFGSTEELAFFELVPAVPGLSISAVEGFTTGSTTVTLTLVYTGGDQPSGGTLAVKVVRDAHSGNLDLTTGTVAVAATVKKTEKEKETPAAADLGTVNESILPELSRAMWRSALDAVTGRLAGVTGVADDGAAGGLAAVAEALRANERALEDGSASWKDLLGGRSFTFTLKAGDSGGARGGQGAAVWGTGDWRRLAREESAFDWSGDLFAAHLGVDFAAREDLRAGLAGSWFSSDVDYRGDGAVEGAHESRTTMLSPWLGWDLGAGARLWGALGIGGGEVRITDEDRREHSADSRFLAAGAGGAKRVWSDGALALDAKGSLEATRYEVKGNGGAIPALTVTTRRARVSVEGSHVRALEGGATVTETLEVGARWDTGDGATGAGLEAGGGLAWADPSRGLTLEARGRVLVAHRRDLDDWGVAGALRVDPGFAGRGLAFRLAPSWGMNGSGGAARGWEDGAGVFPDGGAGTRAPAEARLEAELGYGLPAFSGAGTATPYTGFTSGGDGERGLHVGARLGLGDDLDLDLRARHDRAPGGARGNLVELRINARW